jgi:hypothetical protein
MFFTWLAFPMTPGRGEHFEAKNFELNNSEVNQ